MTTTIISTNSNYPFGQMTSQAIAKLVGLNTQLLRLGEAIATASSGFSGTPGTQFEAPSGGLGMNPTNLFGVVPSETPGEQGEAYRYAMDNLNAAWMTFWVAAEAYIKQLDNGGNSM